MTRITKISALCFGLLTAMLLFTNPNELPSVLLIVPFLLVFVLLLLTAITILGNYSAFGRAKVRVAALIATLPTTLLILQSLGQLTVRDVLAISALLIIGYFYMQRFGSQSVN
jgi:hypothetical protein